MVEAWIRGSEIHDQQIVLTAHIQEEMTSANDDGSGCANLLEIGRALARLIKDGTLPRPRRDIRFWWVNELSSEPQLLPRASRRAAKLLLDINQDMVGARQSWGGRVQYASRLPWSLPHPLDDVMESVLGAVRDGNTSYLSNRGTGQPAALHPKEITATKGSREPFARADGPLLRLDRPPRLHAAPGGRPGHQPHQLARRVHPLHRRRPREHRRHPARAQRGGGGGRVALLRDARGRRRAGASPPTWPRAGARRLAADTATAVAHVVQAAPDARAAAWRAGWNMLRQSVAKEQAALASLRRLAGRGRAGELLQSAARRLEGELGSELDALERGYTALTGQNLPNVDLAKDEREMADKVFVPLAEAAAFEDALERMASAGSRLHPMMRFETLNFADGRRSAWEVYEAVAAEALSGGEWYFGAVTPADVLAVLEAGAKAGAFTVRKR